MRKPLTGPAAEFAKRMNANWAAQQAAANAGGGMPGMPGMPGGKKGKEDKEHKTADYLKSMENTKLLLGEQKSMPAVLGAEYDEKGNLK